MSDNIPITIIPSNVKKSTRAEAALAVISPDHMSSLLTIGACYSESTIKKHS